MDVKQQVVFFTPKGRALFGAPPVNPEPGRPRAVGEGTSERESEGGSGSQPDRGAEAERTSRVAGALAPPPIHAAAGIPRWKRDADIPWEVEARAREALDPG